MASFFKPPSINKQLLLSCFLSQLYLHWKPYYSCNISHFHFSKLIIPSRPTPCPTPATLYTKLLSPLGLSPCFELSYLVLFTFFFPVSFSATCRSTSQIDRQFRVGECALCRILNPNSQPDTPSLTESVYLEVANIPNAAGCFGSLHLVPCSHLIVLETAALWWQSGNYILQSVIPTCTPQGLSTLALLHYSPTIALLLLL